MKYTLFAAGGYIVQTIGVNGLAPGRQKLEASMRKLHDEGKWDMEGNQTPRKIHAPLQ